jgi:hypothetical protein
MTDMVNHPNHYGGDSAYEVIKVLEAWDWKMAYGFCVGNTIKYFARAGKKHNQLEDMRKGAWYATKAVEILERHQYGPAIVESIIPMIPFPETPDTYEDIDDGGLRH